jgi:hypothetical protein
MAETALERTLDVPVTFERRPAPLPCDLRPVWRLHVLVLMLDQCWGGKATHQQLHVLNWAIRTEETRAAFLQFIEGERAPNQIIVRYDPSLNRAVDFAFGEGLATHHEESDALLEQEPPRHGSYRVILTKKGRDLVRTIRSAKDSFQVEKDFLDSIRRKITQQQVEALFTWSTS